MVDCFDLGADAYSITIPTVVAVILSVGPDRHGMQNRLAYDVERTKMCSGFLQQKDRNMNSVKGEGEHEEDPCSEPKRRRLSHT